MERAVKLKGVMELLDTLRKMGFLKEPTYDIPPLDTIGRRFVRKEDAGEKAPRGVMISRQGIAVW